MSDEVQIEGMSYISSKQAAVVSGYAQDYIGQLARKGLIDARRIGGLWHVSMDSLESYKKKAEEYKPQPPAPRLDNAEPGTLIFFDGKEYASAGEAAQQTGYTQDYVGQLARSGAILSRQVGNRWYVERKAIIAHKKEKDSLLAAVQSESVGLARRISPENHSLIKQSNPNDSGYMPILNYTKEDSDLMPITNKQVSTVNYAPISTDTPASTNPIQIKRIHEVPVTRFQASPKGKILVPTSTGLKSPVMPLLLASAATIIIVLSVGYASVLKQNSVYATNTTPGATQVRALAANAGQLFTSLGDILEPLLTRELDYVRSD